MKSILGKRSVLREHITAENRRERGGTIMEDNEQNENRPASARIYPRKGDVLLVSILSLVSIERIYD